MLSLCPSPQMIANNIEQLLAGKGVGFATPSSPASQLFRLTDFILDDGVAQSPTTRTIAANIARVFHRHLFLDVLDEVN